MPTVDAAALPGDHRGTQLPIGLAVGVGAALLGFGAIGVSSDAGYGGVGPNFLPWVVAVVSSLAADMRASKARG